MPVHGPHAAIAARDARERFALTLFDELWDRYRARVVHVASYERVVAAAGARFVNDHIAFRTLATQRPPAGMASLSRIFEALGYAAAGCYAFPDKHLSAIHFQHPHPEFPKLFISELRTWELDDEALAIVARCTADHRPATDLDVLQRLTRLDGQSVDVPPDRALLDAVIAEVTELPWPVPERSDVESLNRATQYGAWVLVHGYNVNHFTSLINSQDCPALDSIEKTIAALKRAGVPMKDEIEGAVGSKLRQTATAAAVLDVPVKEEGLLTTMPWTYAYFELAERGEVVDPATGKPCRFEGFLGAQATNLFEMTRRG